MRPSKIASPPVQPISLEQLRDRLGEDDVRAEVRHVPRDRTPAGRRSVDRDDDLRRATRAALRPHVAVLDAQRAACARTGRRRRRRPHGEVRERAARAARSRRQGRGRRDGRQRRTDPRRDLLRIERNSLLGAPTRAAAATASVDRSVLRRRAETINIPRLTQPDVVAACLGEGTDAGHDLLAGTGELDRTVAAEQR